jgi:hypothetical protein
MRFITMIKSAENAGPPPKAFVDAITKFGEESFKEGTLVEGSGLFPSAAGARVRLASGNLTVTDGPFAETKEMVGGYGVYAVKSKKEAVELTLRFMQLYKEHWPGWEGETEVRQLFEKVERGPGGK